ncbi:MAG TPA: aminotransferase class III-fold pyridoxal phosphate-dependent enzyme [Candidatus Acidoferrales bacterium]|nr:aminotransferase class III-fold pyridoxal phosphate-dependent enzyme [Candidatus Acidoferrales bacterium]
MPQHASADEAVHVAKAVYGLDASASPLPGEYDDNFHVTITGGGSFVLKLMHPSRERSFIDLQCRALRHLEVHARELSLPRVMPTQRGEDFAIIRLKEGEERFVWLLTFLNGTVLAKAKPHTPELLRSLGRLLGEIDRALLDFTHPAAKRELKWDSAQALWICKYLSHIENPSRRALIERVVAQYQSTVVSLLPILRRSVIYGDANDYNVLVRRASGVPETVSVIDLGDMHYGLVASEPAIAAAYAILGEREPIPAATAIVNGFHHALPLDESEISVLFPLIEMRLAVSLVNSACRKKLLPADPYVTVSEQPAWEALERLSKINPRFANYAFRHACGLPPVPKAPPLEEWLFANGRHATSVLDLDLRHEPCHVLDLSVSSTFLGADPKNSEVQKLAEAIEKEVKEHKSVIGVGRYDEPRLLYTSALFGDSENPTDERRTVHIGIDLFVPADSNVRAPLDGVIHAFADNRAPLDFGPVVILKHSTGDGHEFFTLHGHLSRESLKTLSVGKRIAKGEAFAKLGNTQENGGWPPHLHFQIIADLLDLDRDFPGVALASERAIWKSLCPDPNLLLRIPAERFPAQVTFSETLSQRRALLGRNLTVSYNKPLKIVRGWRQCVYDDTGRAYLDVFNNVPLVGHSHPNVVRAAQKQLALLNTNTRYLHENIVRYAKRLTDKLPHPLRVCYFVNSGSEANELALRLARAKTKSDDTIVLEHAYHGHTTTLIDISPYKFNGPGGNGRKPWVHVVPIADDYRGIYRRGQSDLGLKYAHHIGEVVNHLQTQGRGAATFIAETMPSVGGQIVFPDGYLAESYRHVRAAGGVCIADEVQVGFARLGTHFWGFETQGVVPDIVVLGKPIGNGFPLAAVVTTPEIAEAFDNGMEFFSTFGGNPVACAAGLAVLDVLEKERLQENALRVGGYLVAGLRQLQGRHALIGDVRGSGFFLGLDLVRDRETRTPATEQAAYVVNRLRDRGVMSGTDGPHHNVIKLRPPLIFSEADADLFLETLDSVLEEDLAQPE